MSILFKDICACCGEEIKAGVVLEKVWGDDTETKFCSFECVEHVQEQYQEYLDSYEV